VETRIKEYPSKQEFAESENTCKGVVLTFVPRITIEHTMRRTVSDLKSFFKYFMLRGEDDLYSTDLWIQTQKDENPNYVLANTAYWGLDQYSCVLVKRNRAWFNTAIPYIERLWRTVERERVTGCEHRLPKKREAKQPVAHMNITKLPENASNISNKSDDENINEQPIL
jgi:hypothetical protein